MDCAGSQGGSDEKAGSQFDFDALEKWRSGGGRGAAEVERWRREVEGGERWRREVEGGERRSFDHLRSLDKCNVNNPLENKHIAMMLKSQSEEATK